MDTGVDSAHEFLKDRIIPVNKNFVNSEPNSNDGHSHGTHVAGIIRDATLPNVKILPVKAMDNQGRGSSLSVYNGVMFAISQNCDVINMSLGGYGKSELQEETIREAVSQNISVVVAAGNDSIDASWETPSRVPEAITVGAIASSGDRASYSNYGDVVDIWAPGSEILSSVPGNQYEKKNGTSMASPCVAAAAAMLKTFDKTLSPRQIEVILQENGTSSWFYFPTGSKVVKKLNLLSLKTLSRERILDAVATPKANLPSGYYQEEGRLVISCDTPGAVIRYTTDGTVPTEDTGEVYTGPIILNTFAQLHIKAFQKGYIDSYCVESVYYISDYIFQTIRKASIIKAIIITIPGSMSALTQARGT